MSQASAPAEAEQKPKPDETQAASAGIKEQAQKMHEDALNGKPDVPADLKAAVAQAITDQFAVTEGWKPKQVVKFIVNFPSGQSALVKHLDTMDLIRAKLLREMDFFTRKLFPTRFDDQGTPVDDTGKETGVIALLEDPEKRVHFLDLMNRLMTVALVRPKVVNDGVALRVNPETGEEEDVFGYQVESIDEQVKLFGKPVPPLKDGEAYAGAIDFNDRMTLFNELNKPLAVIEPFRESATRVADMARSEGAGDTTE